MVPIALLAFLLLLSPSVAHGSAATHVCIIEGERQVRIALPQCRGVHVERTPTPPAAVRPKPRECERIAEQPDGTIRWDATLDVGRERTFCFDMTSVPTAKPGGFSNPNFEVQSQNRGNASCADTSMQGFSPTGAISAPSSGAQPGVSMKRAVGTFYISVRLDGASNDVCRSYVFTVLK